MSEQEDVESQKDEVEALSAIYGEDFFLHEDKAADAVVTFDISIFCDEEKWWAVTISVLLPTTYPSTDPPVFEVHTECLSHEELETVYKQLDELWVENCGTNVLYIWVENIREFLFAKYEMAKQFIQSTEEEKERERVLTDLMRISETDNAVIEDAPSEIEYIAVETTAEPSSVPVPHIISGETVTVKKSTFQGHVAIVHTMLEVKAVLRKLKENRKVAIATHNIVAYRLQGVKENSFIQDYCDDGEVNAGGRLLHLLQIMDVQNIVVVVSRWYGGILLGPDRFRLINNSARDVIVSSGAYVPKQEKSKHKKKR